MSTAPPRRRAVRPPSRWERALTRTEERIRKLRSSRFPQLLWVLAVVGGLAALVFSGVGIGPEWLGAAGSTAIASAYTWALAARAGGRPLFFGALAFAYGVTATVAGTDVLTTGAAVGTCVVSAVLAVMATVPAVRFVHAAREAVVALLVAAVGAVATVGFEPTISLLRFEYVTLGLALAGALGLVYRLGAGLHGLGRRGVVVVLVGSVVLGVTLAYAELLRRYGTPGLVGSLLDGIRWTRAELGAFPRPLVAVLGIPALVWGCYMRARRRQGWWVCAFGVAATAPVAQALVNTTVSRTEALLAVLYALVVGLAVGFVLVRLDLRFTAPKGRRGRRAEEAASAVRPEPGRTEALL
ncbi:hypothetical protein ACFP3Q_05905 [Nocardioides sp. GCM10027113]|uniref:hypothetical protein n=1 Tax=unclassified Nocardioides TaxID=2615069 RepID=UPI0036180191